jgi:O-antigen biosynthesis protein
LRTRYGGRGGVSLERGKARSRPIPTLRKGGLRRFLFSRSLRLEPRAVHDVLRLSDGRWQTVGTRPLVGLTPEAGAAIPSGDVRFEMEVARGEVFHATLVVETGDTFARGLRIPLPVPRAGKITLVLTLPPSTVGLGLELGTLGFFRPGAFRFTELSAVGAVWAHAAPQLSGLVRRPAHFPVMVGRAVRLLYYRGLSGVFERLRQGTRRQTEETGYEVWAGRYAALINVHRDSMRAGLQALRHRPKFSLLLGRTVGSEALLSRTVSALEGQLYPHWELRLTAEDASEEVRRVVKGLDGSGRVHLVPGREALSEADGELLARLEPGDVLSEHALFAVAQAVARNPGLALVYTDEDQEDQAGKPADPAFKPNWSPELLRSRDYVGRAAFFRTKRVQALGGWPPGPGDVPQHGLLLRYTWGLTPECILHIPEVLLHTCRGKSLTLDEEAGVRALQGSLDVAGVNASVVHGRRAGTYRVRYALPNPAPLVTVIIPTRDRYTLLRKCIHSVREGTSYQPVELIVVDNASRERRARGYLDELERTGAARLLRYPYPFNFSAMNNLAAREARGELLCLLNNDVEATDPDWLQEMVGHALQPGIGAVGAKLLYPNNTVQHAGAVAGLFGVAAHSNIREPRDADGYLLELQVTREVAAVTGACMVLRRDLFLDVGGLDEAELRVSFSDIDLCFRLLQAGYRNIWTPYAELHHLESVSRGSDERRGNRQRFLAEELVMRRRWGALIERDPYFNPNLSLDSNIARPSWPPRVKPAWASQE